MTASECELTVLRALSLPGTEVAVGLVRRYLRGLLGEDFPGLYELEVVASELFTNAVRHTKSGRGGRVVVAILIGDGIVRVEVTDEGSGELPQLREASEECVSGRGLKVVAGLSREWGVVRSSGRTTVWSELPTGG